MSRRPQGREVCSARGIRPTGHATGSPKGNLQTCARQICCWQPNLKAPSAGPASGSGRGRPGGQRDAQQVARRETCQCVRARPALQHRCERRRRAGFQVGRPPRTSPATTPAGGGAGVGGEGRRHGLRRAGRPATASTSTSRLRRATEARCPPPGAAQCPATTRQSPRSALYRTGRSGAHTFAGFPSGNLLGVPLRPVTGHLTTECGHRVLLDSGFAADGKGGCSPAASRRSRTLWWDRRWWPPT